MNTQKKIPIGLLIGLVGFPQISETIYTPALPNVAAGLLATAQSVEATLAIYFFGFAIGVSTWGAISDKFGRRNTMLLGILIYILGSLACGMSKSIEALLVWRLLQAFGASVGSVITQTILRDAYDGSERAKLFSVMSGALAFSPALGPVVGGFISEACGWRANFWVLVAMGLILMIWSFFSLAETRPKALVAQRRRLFFDMMKSPRLWGHILLIGATNAILFGFYQEAPFVFIDQLGVKPSHYGFLGLLIAAATIVAARISYQTSKHASPETLILWGSWSVTLSSILFLLIVLLDLFRLDFYCMMLIFSTLFLTFFGMGLIIPSSLSYALKPYQQDAGKAGSIFGGCYYCLIAASTFLMSLLHDGTAMPLPLYMLAFGIVLMLGSTLIQQPEKTNPDHLTCAP